MRTHLLLLLLATVTGVACGPPPKPTEHPGKASFGTPCTNGKCLSDLDCVRAGGYGGETGQCEMRCMHDSDCGDGSRCDFIEHAPTPMCRGKGG